MSANPNGGVNLNIAANVGNGVTAGITITTGTATTAPVHNTPSTVVPTAQPTTTSSSPSTPPTTHVVTTTVTPTTSTRSSNTGSNSPTNTNTSVNASSGNSGNTGSAAAATGSSISIAPDPSGAQATPISVTTSQAANADPQSAATQTTTQGQTQAPTQGQTQQTQTQGQAQTQGQTQTQTQQQAGQAQQTAQAPASSSVIVLPNGVNIQVPTNSTGTILQPATGTTTGTAPATSAGGVSIALPTNGNAAIATSAAAGIAIGSGASSVGEGAITGALVGSQIGGKEGAVVGAITGAITAAINQDSNKQTGDSAASPGVSISVSGQPAADTIAVDSGQGINRAAEVTVSDNSPVKMEEFAVAQEQLTQSQEVGISEAGHQAAESKPAGDGPIVIDLGNTVIENQQIVRNIDYSDTEASTASDSRDVTIKGDVKLVNSDIVYNITGGINLPGGAGINITFEGNLDLIDSSVTRNIDGSISAPGSNVTVTHNGDVNATQSQLTDNINGNIDLSGSSTTININGDTSSTDSAHTINIDGTVDNAGATQTVDVSSAATGNGIPTDIHLSSGQTFHIPSDWSTLPGGNDTYLVMDNQGELQFVVDRNGNVVGAPVDSNPVTTGINAGAGAQNAGDGAVAGAINGLVNGDDLTDVVAGAIGGAIAGAINDASNSNSGSQTAAPAIGNNTVPGSQPSNTPISSGTQAPLPATGQPGDAPVSSETQAPSPTTGQPGNTPVSSETQAPLPATGQPFTPVSIPTASESTPFSAGLSAGGNTGNAGDGAISGALAGLNNGGSIEDALTGAAAGALGGLINDAISGGSGNSGPAPMQYTDPTPTASAPFTDAMPAPVSPGAFTPVPSAPIDGFIDSAAFSPAPVNNAPLTTPVSPATSYPADPTYVPGVGSAPPVSAGSAPVGSQPVDPTTGLPYDPHTGQLLDPGSGQPIGNVGHSGPSYNPTVDPGYDPTGTGVNPTAGRPIDPTTGLPYDPSSGKLLDPVTGQPVGNVPQSVSGPSGPAQGLQNPVAGKPIDPTTGLPYDPDSGKLLDPNTGNPVGNVPRQSSPTDPQTAQNRPDTSVSERTEDGDKVTDVDNVQKVQSEDPYSGDFKPGKTRTEEINPDGVVSHVEHETNLADILANELAKIQESIESRLQDLHDSRVSDARAGAISQAASDSNNINDIASRQEILDTTAEEQARIERELESDRIKDKMKEDERRREEEEDRLNQRKEQIKKLTDNMMAIHATRRRAELERIRKLLEQQRKIEEFTATDVRRTEYTIRKGDTLESIAKRMFRDPRISRLIYELNKNQITVKVINGQTVYEIKPGAKLRMPSPREAREWVMRGKYMTVVDETFVPQERMSEEERRELEERRHNVESMLGSLGLALEANHAIKYTVRFGDSFRSIAMKHPALNDVSLWRLLAEKNGFSTETNAKGTPVAEVKRGMSLVLPNRDEIADFRRKNGVIAHPSSTRLTGNDLTRSVKMAKDCGSCKATVPAGVSMCPDCGHIFESTTSVNGLKTIFSVVKNNNGVKTQEEPPVTSQPGDNGVPTQEDPAAEDSTVIVKGVNGVDTADLDTLDTDNLESSKPAKPFLSGVQTTPDPLAPMAAALSGETSVENDSETVITSQKSKVSPIAAEEFSASASLMQSISDLHARDESEVEQFIEKLSDTCRLVQFGSEKDRAHGTRLQLEVQKDDQWIAVIAYEMKGSRSVRHEYSLDGAKKKSIKMDLPPAALNELVHNDLASNWKDYCKKFLEGKKITA
ncbi:MAG: LysM peptidoglycan-binding domain-containing protein [Candidatus Melainabacteria bacterium]|nr:LysM peptidoglycan-binding domain-containing protein [Candidatus Melainabacteria bacterium]